MARHNWPDETITLLQLVEFHCGAVTVPSIKSKPLDKDGICMHGVEHEPWEKLGKCYKCRTHEEGKKVVGEGACEVKKIKFGQLKDASGQSIMKHTFEKKNTFGVKLMLIVRWVHL